MSPAPVSGGWFRQWAQAWDRFWFTPRPPHTLAVIRILAGAMLFYTHWVWSLDWMAFAGPKAWIPTELSRQAASGTWVWSHLWYLHSPTWLWAAHIGALVVFAGLTLGIATRMTAILAWLLAVSYCHRLNGALFGLDQINVTMAFCLAIGSSGSVYSIDAWWARRRGKSVATANTSTNIAIRLLQLHLCIIYLFGGIGKLRGETWWIGDAFWYSIANYEYQSMDMTWMARYPTIMSAISHVTVFWETFYCALVWPKLSRPIAIGLAVVVHGGIALFLGMPTFGIAMIIANMAFIPEHIFARWTGR